MKAVSKDKQIYYNFRVRRSYVQDLLKLLIRDNHLYSDYTFDEDDESWALLPDDGIPESIPIWEEAKPEDERRPKAELQIPVTTLQKWLEAGIEDDTAYPMAAACSRIWSQFYELNIEMEALADAILRTPKGSLRPDMMCLADIAMYMEASGALVDLPNLDRGNGLLPDIHSQSQKRSLLRGQNCSFRSSSHMAEPSTRPKDALWTA